MVDVQDYALTDGRWAWVRATQVQRFGDLTGATGAVILLQPGSLDSAPPPMTFDDALSRR